MKDSYRRACDSAACESNRKGLKDEQHLQLIPASGLLKFAAMNKSGSLPQRKSGNTFDTSITNWVLKLTQGITAPKTTRTFTVSFLSNFRFVGYEVPDFHLTGHGSPFMSKPLATRGEFFT